MKRRGDLFDSVHTEGGLLPTELLGRIASGDDEIPGLDSEHFHVGPGMRLHDAIGRSWTRALGAWRGFVEMWSQLPAASPDAAVTRDRWLLVLFEELGYGRLAPARGLELDGKAYPISHVWSRSPIHLVGFRTTLDGRTKGVAGAARWSPHSLVQEFLNRSDDHLWGFVSNGLTLRILRDNVSLTRQAFLEFDLERMMTAEGYADFALFWVVAHRSRVEPRGDPARPEQCWLEEWTTVARDQGARALDRLRAGVEEALAALGRGFLAHPANGPLRVSMQAGTIAPHDYYRELLRFVYRLIFLFVAEDRGLLLVPETQAQPGARHLFQEYYSTRRLRRLASRRRGGPHQDLYRALRLVIRKLGSDSGCPEMALPALGGFFWLDDAGADLLGSEIANRDLLAAVRALAFNVGERSLTAVDFRNLGAEELGSLYESLLELEPVVRDDGKTFELRETPGHERKATGSYYTPTGLIRCLLDSALDPILDEAGGAKDPEHAILDLKICDPACGSGHFLIAAAHRIARRLAALRTGDAEPAPGATRTALRDVIRCCLYGVDLNAMAVELCKVNLWLETIEPGKPLSFLDARIRCGNSLLGATPDQVIRGIPDEAFEPIDEDERPLATALRRRNAMERQGQQTFLHQLTREASAPISMLGAKLNGLARTPDDVIGTIQSKAIALRETLSSSEYRRAHLAADTWCAAFVWPKKSSDSEPPTQELMREILTGSESVPASTVEEVTCLSTKHSFFHWHLAFPDVFTDRRAAETSRSNSTPSAGFDVILGNPPYGAYRESRERGLLRFNAPLSTPAKTSAAGFIERAAGLVRVSGRAGLVVPKSYTYSETWRDLRAWQRGSVTAIVDAGKAWKEVDLEQILLTFRSRAPSEPPAFPERVGRLDTAGLKWCRFPQAAYVADFDLLPTGLEGRDLDVLDAIFAASGARLRDFVSTRRGTNLQRHMRDAGAIPIIGGRDLAAFEIRTDRAFLPTGAVPVSKVRLVEPPQAVFQNIVSFFAKPGDHVRLTGGVVESRVACLDTVNLIDIQDETSSPYAVAAFLMSSLIGWYAGRVVYNRAQLTMHFDNWVLEKIPVPSAAAISDLDTVGGRLARDPRDGSSWRDLDELVFDAYRVPRSLRAHVMHIHGFR